MERLDMGSVHAEITLKNIYDKRKVLDGLITEAEIRSLTVSALVDAGAMNLCINEETRQKLGLGIEETRYVKVANGARVPCPITEGVEVIWKNRSTICRAYVVPGLEMVLLGVIPLEDMDLTVNPLAQELVGVHGDDWLGMI